MTPAPTRSLLSGIGVVIDNMANAKADAGDPIADLLDQIEDAGIPYLVYEQIPPEAARAHLGSAAFILLDWELWERPVPNGEDDGLPLGGQELARQGAEDNIAFLKSLRNVCFGPVFIFSHLAPEGIRNHLQEAGLLGEPEERSFILVRNKADLKRPPGSMNHPLLDAVTAWIAGNPAIYVLSRWRTALGQSQTHLFWDLYDKDHYWPGVLWQAYEDDGDNPEHSLADVLLRNLRARMVPLALERGHVLPDSMPSPNASTLRAVLESSMIIPRLETDSYGCGDIFKSKNASGSPYRLNIRGDCDCIARDGHHENVLLYLLTGRIVSESELVKQEVFSERTGFARPMNQAYVFPLDDGKCVAFKFKDLEQKTVSALRLEGGIRIGRLTAPHITDIRQRYAQWLQREGFPKIPAAAVRELAASPSEETATE